MRVRRNLRVRLGGAHRRKETEPEEGVRACRDQRSIQYSIGEAGVTGGGVVQ